MAKLKKAKIDPKIQYRFHPQDGERCGLCTMFVRPEGCTDVAGQISRWGWCKIFARKKRR
jgi:hypothetical protein